MGDRTEEFPLLGSFHPANEPEEPPLKRTGTIWTATAHVITGVIGAGVLSLAWSMAQLDFLIPNMAPSETGPTWKLSGFIWDSDSIDNSISGEKSQIVCGIFAEESLYGCGIAYTITSAGSIRCETSTLLCFLPNFLYDELV
ncbi:hypothetical protein DKX38_018039 [Salix brachista]|uniref:Amino acid transporter transmembrane domain-containing protein n=1 Tax=Salix brachista TaxID=2182728 RepID=A0A5N5KWV2_9ROSI|nr:hypothetical protein DKX38_018039 [Salix brachista]